MIQNFACKCGIYYNQIVYILGAEITLLTRKLVQSDTKWSYYAYFEINLLHSSVFVQIYK